MGDDLFSFTEVELRAMHERLLQEVVVDHADRRLESGEFLRGEIFVFADWAPPPPEWVSVARNDDGAVVRISIRREPGPPGWPEDEPPAWDHDHCALCMRTLSGDASHGDEVSGWRSGEDWGSFTWVCTGCFGDFESRLDWKRAGGSLD